MASNQWTGPQCGFLEVRQMHYEADDTGVYECEGALLCKRPDRDAPKLTCGHPLPCPHHTLVVLEKDLPALLRREWHVVNINALSYIGG
jgi:hypothetical protein